MRYQQLLGAVCLLALAAGSASAQSTYVGASLVGDVVRRSHSESGGVRDLSTNGEAIGFSLRVGTQLGRRWGVDLEFVRPGEIETDFTPAPIPLAQQSLLFSSGTTPPGVTPPAVNQIVQLFPTPLFRLETQQRYSTLSTSVWVGQELSRRVSLVYLAGMGFFRATLESEFSFDFLRGVIGIPIIFPPMQTKTVTYGVRPLVGLEARIGMTEHLNLVPGIRLHGVEGGWLLRPAVGLDWEF